MRIVTGQPYTPKFKKYIACYKFYI